MGKVAPTWGEYPPSKVSCEREKRSTAIREQHERPIMGNRVRFFDHEGKRILLVDFSNCKAHEVEEVTRKVPDYVTSQPLDWVLILTDFAASFNGDALLSFVERPR